MDLLKSLIIVTSSWFMLAAALPMLHKLWHSPIEALMENLLHRPQSSKIILFVYHNSSIIAVFKIYKH